MAPRVVPAAAQLDELLDVSGLHPDQVAQRAAAGRRGLHATEQALADARAEAEGAQASGTAARAEVERLRVWVTERDERIARVEDEREEARAELVDLRAAVVEWFRCYDGAGTIREKRAARDRIAELVDGVR